MTDLHVTDLGLQVRDLLLVFLKEGESRLKRGGHLLDIYEVISEGVGEVCYHFGIPPHSLHHVLTIRLLVTGCLASWVVHW